MNTGRGPRVGDAVRRGAGPDRVYDNRQWWPCAVQAPATAAGALEGLSHRRPLSPARSGRAGRDRVPQGAAGRTPPAWPSNSRVSGLQLSEGRRNASSSTSRAILRCQRRRPAGGQRNSAVSGAALPPLRRTSGRGRPASAGGCRRGVTWVPGSASRLWAVPFARGGQEGMKPGRAGVEGAPSPVRNRVAGRDRKGSRSGLEVAAGVCIPSDQALRRTIRDAIHQGGPARWITPVGARLPGTWPPACCQVLRRNSCFAIASRCTSSGPSAIRSTRACP